MTLGLPLIYKVKFISLDPSEHLAINYCSFDNEKYHKYYDKCYMFFYFKLLSILNCM